mgnify:FL=1
MKKLILSSLTLASIAMNSFAGGTADPLYSKVTIDSLEKQNNDEKSLSWEGNIWTGYDLNKLYLYTEGEKGKDSSAQSENQLVFSHAISPYWDIQIGLGYDKTPSENQTWGVLSLQGMAPYFVETRLALLSDDEGNLGMRLEAEYDALITQKLSLSPSISSSLYSDDIPEMEIGKGLSNITLGLRLNYDITREFSPYIGIEWNKNYGNTNDFNQNDETYAVAGFKFWF